MVQNQEKLLQLLKQVDVDEMGSVPKDDFCDSITGMQAPVEDEELKKVGECFGLDGFKWCVYVRVCVCVCLCLCQCTCLYQQQL